MRKLGKTNIEVSEICFGVLTMSPLQSNFTQKQYMPVIEHAIERGINFFDTAELYDAYHIIKDVLRIKKDAVISTKSYAYDLEGAKRAVDNALKECGRDYIDIFMMHEQESIYTIRGHFEALEYYLKMKEQGVIKAVGLSTHLVSGVSGANAYNEIELIHPLLNYSGFGIFDGSISDMEKALRDSASLGKGILAMKIFGGGNLLKSRQQCVDYILGLDFVTSSAIGMQTIEEIDCNLAMFDRQKDIAMPTIADKVVKIMSWCQLCGKCIKKCPQNAMSIENGCVIIDKSKCLLCGYCGSACENLCIKIF